MEISPRWRCELSKAGGKSRRGVGATCYAQCFLMKPRGHTKAATGDNSASGKQYGGQSQALCSEL